jgi:hypothetical protein
MYLQRLNSPGVITAPITYGGGVQEFIGSFGEVDTYTFRANINDRVTLRMARGSVGSVSPLVALYDPDGKLVTIGSTVENQLLRSTGRYVILAADWFTETGSYTIGLDCRPERLDFVLPLVFVGQATEGLRQTELIFANPLELLNRGTIEFFKADGTRLSVTLRGGASVTGNAFDFSAAANGVMRVQSQDTTALVRGWAFVSVERPLRLNTVIRSTDASGILFESSYQPVPPSKTFSVLADTVGPDTDTVLYIANPSVDQEARISIRLVGRDGVEVTDTPLSLRALSPRGQVSVSFLGSFPTVAGIEEFEGTALITSSVDVSLVVLKRIGSRLTVVPAFQ